MDVGCFHGAFILDEIVGVVELLENGEWSLESWLELLELSPRVRSRDEDPVPSFVVPVG